MSTQLLQDLIRVKNLIILGGWQQGAYYSSGTGCYCLAGAVHASSGEGFAYTLRKVDVFQALTEALGKPVDRAISPEFHVVNWNDNETREKREVIDLLDKAIAKEKEA